MSFTATVRHLGDVAVVDLAGRLVFGEPATALHNVILDLITAGEKKILLNLKEVSYLDSAGMGEMFAAHASVTSAGGEIKLLSPGERIHGQMEVTKLSTVFRDYKDEAVAAKSFKFQPTKA